MLVELLLGFASLLLGSGLIFYGSKNVNAWRKTSSLDKCPISEAIVQDESVKIEGKVKTQKPRETLTSPIKGEKCVAYKYEIRDRAGKEHTHTISDTEYVPFIISDGTGQIYVYPDEESINPKLGKTETMQTQDLIELPNIDISEDNMRGTRRVKEGSIPVGENATVIGQTQSAPNNPNVNSKIESENYLMITDDTDTIGKRKLLIGTLTILIGIMFTIFSLATFLSQIGIL